MAACSEVKGLVGVKAHVKGISKAKIIHVPPGHVLEYNLKISGKVGGILTLHRKREYLT